MNLSIDVEDRHLVDAPCSDNHVLKRNATGSIQAGDVLTGRPSCKGSGYTVTVKLFRWANLNVDEWLSANTNDIAETSQTHDVSNSPRARHGELSFNPPG